VSTVTGRGAEPVVGSTVKLPVGGFNNVQPKAARGRTHEREENQYPSKAEHEHCLTRRTDGGAAIDKNIRPEIPHYVVPRFPSAGATATSDPLRSSWRCRSAIIWTRRGG
jgi:hypothetical protein